MALEVMREGRRLSRVEILNFKFKGAKGKEVTHALDMNSLH